MRTPLDPFSEVVDEDRRWNPEWYSWLTDLSAAITQLQNQSGLILISSQTVSSPVPFIDFVGLTPVHEVYSFEGSGLRCSLEGAGIFLRGSQDNGASFISTGAYWYDLVYHYQNSPTPGSANATFAIGSNFIQITHGGTFGAPFETLNFSLKAYNLGNPALIPHFLFQSGNYSDTGGIMYLSGSGTMLFGLANALRFLPHLGGNITAGTISCYGLHK